MGEKRYRCTCCGEILREGNTCIKVYDRPIKNKPGEFKILYNVTSYVCPYCRADCREIKEP